MKFKTTTGFVMRGDKGMEMKPCEVDVRAEKTGHTRSISFTADGTMIFVDANDIMNILRWLEKK